MEDVNNYLHEHGFAEDKISDSSDLLKQFAFIYLVFMEKIENELKNALGNTKRVSTTVILEKKINWNIGSMQRVLLEREKKGIGLEAVEKFSEKIMQPLGYVIRMIPINLDQIPNYRFIPYAKKDKSKRELIKFSRKT